MITTEITILKEDMDALFLQLVKEGYSFEELPPALKNCYTFRITVPNARDFYYLGWMIGARSMKRDEKRIPS